VGTVAEGCPATALVLAMQLIQHRALAHNPRIPPALRERLGRGAAERGELVNALRVEPELGTPARGGLPATAACRTAEGWSLAGRKIYSTGSPALAWGLVWARTDEAEPRTGQFLVTLRAFGVTVVETWDGAGLRASGSHDVLFRDVPIPAEHALDLRAPAEWGRPDAEQVRWNTLLVAALYAGVARAARDWLVGFLRDRRPANLGAPLATLPRIQEAVGRIEALLLTNERLVAGAGRRRRARRVRPHQDGDGRERHRRRAGRGGRVRQPRPVPLQPAGTPPARRAVRARPHAAAGQRAPRHRPRGAATDSRTGGDRTVTAPHPVEFIGMIQPRQQSEIHPARGPAIDPGYLVASARVHDEGGFDRILVSWFSNGPDGFQIAAHAGAHTGRVGFLVAHRPGFRSPSVAARDFATLDQLTNGRAAIHVISGGDDADQARDGDWLGKDERYDRTDEYVSVLKSIPQRAAPAQAGELAARLFLHRGEPHASELRAHGLGGPHRRTGQRLPLGLRAGGAGPRRGLPPARDAGPRRPGPVGEGRPQPGLERLQVHPGGRDHRRAPRRRHRGRARGAGHGRGHPGRRAAARL
jgi:alkylation response protein AidB-like acyl-CoA dehydrogenase